LRHDFGLDAFVETQHDGDLESFDKTMICYLTFPAKAVNNPLYFDVDGEHHTAVHSSFVDTASFAMADKHKKRLRNAMKELSLDVFIHHTQLRDRITSFSAVAETYPTDSLAMRDSLGYKGEQPGDEERVRRKIFLTVGESQLICDRSTRTAMAAAPLAYQTRGVPVYIVDIISDKRHPLA